MSGSTTEFHKIWIDQCAATENIRDHFGPQDALGYLIGEKLFTFLWAAERDQLQKTKYLAPTDPDLEMDELDEPDEPDEEEPLLENPVSGAEELLRFSRIRQLLQS